MRLPFFTKKKRALGVDIGTSSIKVAQLALKEETIELETYGEINAESNTDNTPHPTVLLQEQEVAQMLKEVVSATNAETENVNLSVPIFSSFVTTMELPPMSEAELVQAVPFQARKYVPVPLEEVSLDWSVTGKIKTSNNNDAISVLLVAIPNELIQRYVRIARLAGLEISSLEMETFALCRSITKNIQAVVCLVDIGAHSTDIAVIESGTIQMAHNIDIAGAYLTQNIAKSMNVSLARAEFLKRSFTYSQSDISSLQEITSLYFGLIAAEINRIIGEFADITNKKVEQVFLAGSAALQPGLADYLSKVLAIPATYINPFLSLNYPASLNAVVKYRGPTYAVSIGLAMRQFNQYKSSA